MIRMKNLSTFAGGAAAYPAERVTVFTTGRLPVKSNPSQRPVQDNSSTPENCSPYWKFI